MYADHELRGLMITSKHVHGRRADSFPPLHALMYVPMPPSAALSALRLAYEPVMMPYQNILSQTQVLDPGGLRDVAKRQGTARVIAIAGSQTKLSLGVTHLAEQCLQSPPHTSCNHSRE